MIKSQSLNEMLMQIEQEIKDGIEASLTPLPKVEPRTTIHDFSRLMDESEPVKQGKK